MVKQREATEHKVVFSFGAKAANFALMFFLCVCVKEKANKLERNEPHCHELINDFLTSPTAKQLLRENDFDTCESKQINKPELGTVSCDKS